ncbi:MAG: hypothetical protein HOP16_14675 [Acidobacteria bacterium]|nr:hypothetical protein [Acidobacteriota bacterium]
MILLWSTVSASLIVALLAWRQARRTAKQLAQLTERHWELRYQHGELRGRLQRLTGETPPGVSEAPASDAQASGQPDGSFVPLSSLKR